MQKEFLYEATKVDNPFDMIERDIAMYGEEFLKSMDDSEFLLHYGMSRREYLFDYRSEIADYSSNKLDSIRRQAPFTEQSLTNLIEGYKSEAIKHLSAVKISTGKGPGKKPSELQLNNRTSVKPSALKQKIGQTINQKAGQLTEEANEMVADTVSEVKDIAGDLKNTVENNVNALSEKAGRINDTIGKKFRETTGSAHDKLNEAKDNLNDKIRNSKDKATRQVHEAGDAMKQIAGQAKSSFNKRARKLPFPAPQAGTSLNHAEEQARKEFQMFIRSLLKHTKGPFVRKNINLREKALRNTISDEGVSWGTPEWAELVRKFFPDATVRSLNGDDLPTETENNEPTATEPHSATEQTNNEQDQAAETDLKPEASSLSGIKDKAFSKLEEKAGSLLPDGLKDKFLPKPSENPETHETAGATGNQDINKSGNNQADTEQTTQPAQPAQPQSKTKQEEASSTTKAGEQQSNQGSSGSPSSGSEVSPNQTSPPSEGGGGAQGGPAPAGGKNYPKTEHEPVDISNDIEGGAEAMVKGLKSTPPSQMLEAFNKKVKASKKAFEVDVDKAKETIPEMPAPTGLAPRSDDKKPEDEEKPDEAQVKDKFKAEDLKNKIPLKAKTDDLLSSVNFNVTQNLPSPPIGDENAEGADQENMAEEALDQINLETDQIPSDMGPPPEVELAGEANPQIAEQSQAEAEQDVEQAANEAQTYTQGDFGEQNILPEPDDSMIQSEVELQVQEVTAQAQEMEVPEVPPELVGEVDNMLGTEMLPGIEEQQAEFQAQTEAKQAETEEQREQSGQEIEKLQEQAVKEQEAEKKRANADIEAQKQGYQEEVTQMQADFEAEASQQSSATQEQVSAEREKGEAEARKHFNEAEAQAEQEKAKAEKDAQKKKDEKKNEKKGLWGKIVGAVTSVINAVKDAVNAIFEGLRSLVKGIFEAAKKLAMAAIDLATKAITGLIKAFGEILKGLVKTLFAAFPKLQEKLLNAIDKAVNAACEAVNKMAEELKKAVTAALDFLSSVIDMALAFVQELYNIAFTAIGMIVKGEFAELGKYIVKSAVNLIFGTLKQFLALLGISTDALDKIIEDPGGFFKNLVTAVRNGISNFVSNIKKHLLNGLAGWLFGTMGDLGITLPEKFDLKGVIFLVLQILNLTWTNIRAKIVKQLGPKGEAIMSGAEKVVTIVADVIQRGPLAIVDHIKDFIGDLKSMIFSSIIEWVRNTIIVKAIAKLISYFNPAGAIIAVIEGIYNTIMFIKERWEQIKSFCMAVMESITKIAYGQLGEASGWVENSLARVIPVTIGFLARLIGLGGITDKIKKIITNIRKPIDTALDKVIGIIVNAIKKLGGALFGRGGSNNEPGDNEEELEDTEVGKVVRFNADDASHKIWINAAGSDAKVMVASTPMEAIERLTKWETQLNELDDDNKTKAKAAISAAKAELGITEPAADKAKKEIEEAKNTDTPQENQQAEQADDALESSEERLKRYFQELFELFGEEEEVTEISVDFTLESEPHKLLFIPKEDSFTLEMQSTQKELDAKKSELLNRLDTYINSSKIPEDVKNLFSEIKTELGTQIDIVNSKTKSEIEKEIGKAKLNKTPGGASRVKRDKINAILNRAIHSIKQICEKYNIEDISPLGIEKAEILRLQEILAEKQNEVQNVFNAFKAKLQSALPPGSKVMYRGSLASGMKGPHKVTAEGAVKFFDPNDFDCDAFVEVSNDVWYDEIAKDVDAANYKEKLFITELSKWHRYDKLWDIMLKIESDLSHIAGYSIGDAKVNLVIQTIKKSEDQIRAGIRYPLGSLEKAGFPEHEKKLEKTTGPNAITNEEEEQFISPEVHNKLI